MKLYLLLLAAVSVLFGAFTQEPVFAAEYKETVKITVHQELQEGDNTEYQYRLLRNEPEYPIPEGSVISISGTGSCFFPDIELHAPGEYLYYIYGINNPLRYMVEICTTTDEDGRLDSVVAYTNMQTCAKSSVILYSETDVPDNTGVSREETEESINETEGSSAEETAGSMPEEETTEKTLQKMIIDTEPPADKSEKTHEQPATPVISGIKILGIEDFTAETAYLLICGGSILMLFVLAFIAMRIYHES
ncbi:MAG: hypothetical protein IKN57_06655 [Parasporobacterium sp.]|nr:hypothetical protein [Parasporobacterium sp.]